jgi:maleate isomerase
MRQFEIPLPAQTGIGVVAPFDFALDRELWRWVPEQVCLHSTRLPYVPEPVTVRLAEALGDPPGVLRATRDLLVPEPAVVAYACTSGSFAGGAAGEAALVQGMLDAGAPAAVTTSGAMIRACERLGVRRLAVITPYVDAVTERLLAFLGEFGISVPSHVGMGKLGDIWKMSYSDVLTAATAVDTSDADALFISCTNVPTYDLIGPLERYVGRPVLTANQVTMWAALDMAGHPENPWSRWLPSMHA